MTVVNKTIAQLPAANPVQAADKFVIERSLANYNVTPLAIFAGGFDATLGVVSVTDSLHVSTTTIGDGIRAGNSFIGENPFGTTLAVFCHYDFRADASAYALMQNNAGATFINADTNQEISIRIADTPIAVFKDSGLGIGSTTLAAKLNVIDNAMPYSRVMRLSQDDSSPYLITGRNLSYSSSDAFNFYINDSGQLFFGTPSSSQHLHFYTGGLGSYELVVASNRVGINITPTSALHLAGGVSNKFQLGTTTPMTMWGGNGTYNYIESLDSMRMDMQYDLDIDINRVGSGGRYFRVTTANRVTTLFRVNDSGNVGIGLNPSQPLEIALPTENIGIVDAGSVSATQQDWIEVTVNGVTGYLHVHAAK